ncbi:type II secretion system F family protein [Pseudonocardia xinjiangensis]|uniref:type II secretion system F family protein n=1 Tax=Pseudonocardia xinjiangensis TaxID=75289 RepID=UPI003D8FAA54
MTPVEMAAAAAGGCLSLAATLFVAGVRVRPPVSRGPAVPASSWVRGLRRAWAATANPTHTKAQRRWRALGWWAAATAVWALTGWPVAGLATLAAGLWLPWLLGSGRVVHERIATLEALETWCRRMADTLAGGGAIGLAQAIVTSAARIDGPVSSAVRTLARRLQLDQGHPAPALREFADTIDDRTGDAVAAALLLALHQQSTGVAQILRQLADGVARDIRARRDIEAARAESRQSIRMLLVIQVGLLVLLALTPAFAAPYSTPVGQVVMAMLLAGTVALLVWMRRLSLGRRAPRFLGGTAGTS